MKPQTLALLAVGGLLLLTQRKAGAATLATPFGASPASQTRPVSSYYQNPSAAAQYASQRNMQSNLPAQNPLTAMLGAVASLIQPAAPGANPGTPFVNSVYNSATTPDAPGFGWQYFTNGTAIDPAGAYYQNGNLVWAPDPAPIDNAVLADLPFTQNQPK